MNTLLTQHCAALRYFWSSFSGLGNIGNMTLIIMAFSLLYLQQFWEYLAIGRRYFRELESWFKLCILSLALTAMLFMENLVRKGKVNNNIICPGIVQDVLNVVASAAICLAWIEIIFMIGRYPFLGGRFSIMFYSITKKIIQGIVSFIIMVIGFGFAFFVIRKGF